LGALLLFAGVAVFPSLGRGDPQVANFATIGEGADFRVAAEVAEKLDAVQAPCHLPSLHMRWALDVVDVQRGFQGRVRHCQSHEANRDAGCYGDRGDLGVHAWSLLEVSSII